jgi:hypothetical protein
MARPAAATDIHDKLASYAAADLSSPDSDLSAATGIAVSLGLAAGFWGLVAYAVHMAFG